MDLPKMLDLMKQMEETSARLRERRDEAFAKMRADGVYVKAESDEHGEYWVLADDLLDELKRRSDEDPAPSREWPFPDLGSVRVMRYSEWLAQTLPKQ